MNGYQALYIDWRLEQIMSFPFGGDGRNLQAVLAHLETLKTDLTEAQIAECEQAIPRLLNGETLTVEAKIEPDDWRGFVRIGG